MRFRYLAWTAATACAVLAAPAATAAAAAPARADRAEMRTRLDEVVTAGAVGALVEVRDEHGVWRATSGVAELGTTRTISAGSRFRTGSVTKAFVATVVLQLVAEGRLRLDDQVTDLLPGALPDGTDVTVRRLLGHTSGLYDYLRTLTLPPAPEFVANRWRTWTPAELVQRALDHGPIPPGPDRPFAYSNTNYLLLGQIIEATTSRAYGAEIERRILRPLRLYGTSVPGTSTGIPGPHPHGYVPVLRDGRLALVDYTRMNPSMMGASGEMLSTTADLNRFFAALLGDRLLPRHLLTEMLAPIAGGSSHGLGIARRTTSCDVDLYGIDGDALAYQAWSFTTADRRRQITVAFTPNFRGDTDDAVGALLDAVACGPENRR